MAGEAGLEAKAGLDCCASTSGIESGAACFGGLVSCILGRLGDGTGVAIEESGTDALRGAGGGCDGRVYA